MYLRILNKKSVSELTRNDWQFLRENSIVNGCGGKNGGFVQKFFLKILSPQFFTASCEKHDFGYWKGGDSAKRKECDDKFYEAILADIEANSDNFFHKKYWQFIAFCFYLAVRIGGEKYFNFLQKYYDCSNPD